MGGYEKAWPAQLGTEREISGRKKLAVLAMNKLNHVWKSSLNIKKKPGYTKPMLNLCYYMDAKHR